MHFIGELILVLLITTLLGQLFTQLNLPAVIGQLLSGVLLGPAILGLIKTSSTITLFSELGVTFLMLLAGLENDLELLKKYFEPSFSVAFIGVVLPVIFMTIASQLFSMKFLEALFIGIVFTATSVSIPIEVLRDTNQLHTKADTAILRTAIVDDILAAVVLNLFTSFSHEGGNSGLANNLVLNLVIEVVYFVIIWLIFRFIAPYFMEHAERIGANYSVIITPLILTLRLAWAADFTGLSAVVGTFFGGLAIRQTPQCKGVGSAISAIGYSVFIPIFPAGIGFSVTFSSFTQDLVPIIVMTVLALLSKFWAGKHTCELFGSNKIDTDIIGAGMVSRGEVTLIIAQIGIARHPFPGDIYLSLILMIIVTAVLSPLILSNYLKQKATV